MDAKFQVQNKLYEQACIARSVGQSDYTSPHMCKLRLLKLSSFRPRVPIAYAQILMLLLLK